MKEVKFLIMGLMFQVPVEKNELDDRIKIVDGEVILKSYGLPMIFWGYLLAIFVVLIFMVLAIKDPLMRVFSGEDMINKVLAGSVLAIFILGPLILLGFYFYEKEIRKKGSRLKVTHKVFFIPLKSSSIEVGPDGLEVDHHMDSPNKALLDKKEGMKGFENRGYFRLMARDIDGRLFMVDRNGRRGEMKKLKELLSSF